jgi:hypothetical protein
MRKWLAAGSAVLLALAFAAPAAAITNGTPDGDGHPYVGLLVFDDAPGHPAWRCSGSLISPTVVLTAGHCTDGAVAARIWVQSDVTAAHAPDYPYGGQLAIEGTPYTNPMYRSPDNPYGGGNGLPAFSYRDVGVVVLDEPVALDEYAQLPDTGMVDDLANRTGLDYVGFGVQYQLQIPGADLPQPPPYYRWSGPRIRMIASGELVSGNFVHSAEFLRTSLNPGGGSGGTCFGDSGGPILLGGTSTVLGVNSYVTNVNCGGVGYASRIDIGQILSWVGSFLD